MPPHTAFSTLRDTLHALAEQAVQGTPYLLLDLKVRGAKGRTYVDVVADTAEGIGVDELAKLSRELGFVFDTHEAIQGAYNLSVLSPGAKEPLYRHQYPRHVGRTLLVRLHPPQPDTPGEAVEGVLKSVDETGLVLEQSGGTERSLSFDTIQQARVKLPW